MVSEFRDVSVILNCLAILVVEFNLILLFFFFLLCSRLYDNRINVLCSRMWQHLVSSCGLLFCLWNVSDWWWGQSVQVHGLCGQEWSQAVGPEKMLMSDVCWWVLYGRPLSAFSGTVFTRWLRSRPDSRRRLDLGQYHRRWQNLWSQLHQSQWMSKRGESLIWCVMWNPGMRAVNCRWDNSLPLFTVHCAGAVWMYMEARDEGCEQVWSMKVWTSVACALWLGNCAQSLFLSNLYTVTLVLACVCQSCDTLKVKTL
jgi:hypothetical protein